MRNPLKGLERYYGCALAQTRLTPIAEAYVDRWMDAVGARRATRPTSRTSSRPRAPRGSPSSAPPPSTPTFASASRPEAFR